MNCFNKIPTIFLRHSLRTLRREINTLPSMEKQFDYKEAICTLNSLQSNAACIHNIHERIRRREECVNIKETWKFLNRIGVTPEEMDKLSVIHVAGTKGKGSTSAMCESILRQHGYRTGLYSSPHLISVTERIRLDGKPLGKDHFATSFSSVYHQLWKKRESEEDIPGYFMFLTILAFRIFLQQEVDVAVVEVGIGGEYDITNVVSNVTAAGITSLGLEHTAILGNTIEQIAREKGGIMKQGCRAYTVPQPQAAMTVLENIALTRNCTLNVVPDFSSYNWDTGSEPTLLANVAAFKLNASLAIQLSHAWMNRNDFKNGNVCSNVKQMNEINNKTSLFPRNGIDSSYEIIKANELENKVMNTNVNKMFIDQFVSKDMCINEIPADTCEGLSRCVLAGRCQIFKDDSVDYYIDGAHTKESMMVCASWFKNLARNPSMKILIFNTTGDRNAEALLQYLQPLNFQMALFVPNVAFSDGKMLKCLDQISLTSGSKDDQLQRCKENLEVWLRLQKGHDIPNGKKNKTMAKYLNTVEEAIDYIKSTCENNCERPQVVITGSLHLVGAALAVLDPELITSNGLK